MGMGMGLELRGLVPRISAHHSDARMFKPDPHHPMSQVKQTRHLKSYHSAWGQSRPWEESQQAPGGGRKERALDLHPRIGPLAPGWKDKNLYNPAVRGAWKQSGDSSSRGLQCSSHQEKGSSAYIYRR